MRAAKESRNQPSGLEEIKEKTDNFTAFLTFCCHGHGNGVINAKNHSRGCQTSVTGIFSYSMIDRCRRYGRFMIIWDE